MVSILRSQFYRLFRSKTFKSWLIVLIVLVALSFGFDWLAYVSDEEAQSMSFGEYVSTPTGLLDLFSGVDQDTYLMQQYFSATTNYDGDACFCALFCIAVFLSKEFSEGTVRNQLLANKSRTQVVFSYLIVAIVIGAIYLTVYFALILATYGVAVGFGVLNTSQIVSGLLVSWLVGLFAITFIASCCIMFLFVSNKQSATIIFPLLISTFASAVALVIVSIIANFTSVDVSSTIWQWMPVFNKTYFNAAEIDGKIVAKIICTDALMSVLFVLTGWMSFTKKDLK